jgi:hypothetical protein
MTPFRTVSPVSRREVLTFACALFTFTQPTNLIGGSRRVLYDVPLIPQQTSLSCWAAAIAMIVSWARGDFISPSTVAKESNRSETKGHFPLDAELFDRWGMVAEAPQTFSAEGFMNLLDEFGPIWVAADVTSMAHIRVATGFEFGDPPHMGPVYINDPLDRGTRFQSSNKGSRYTESYQEFVDNNERLGWTELSDPSLNDDRRFPVYFAHLTKQSVQSKMRGRL